MNYGQNEINLSTYYFIFCFTYIVLVIDKNVQNCFKTVTQLFCSPRTYTLSKMCDLNLLSTQIADSWRKVFFVLMVSDCLSYLYEGSTLCYVFHHETVDFFSAVEGCKSKATFLAPLLNRQHQVDIGGMCSFNICIKTLTTFL